MPHVAANQVEVSLYAGDLSRVDDQAVLAACLPDLERLFLSDGTVGGIKNFAVQDLKLHLVNVERMSILCEIVDLPHRGHAT